MRLDPTLQKYLAQRPVAVMARAALERAFSAEALDTLFEQTAPRQYTAGVAFRTVVAVLQTVVFRQYPSVRSAHLHGSVDAPLYDELNHTEPRLADARVTHGGAAARCRPAVAAPGRPGARVATPALDGNHLKPVEQVKAGRKAPHRSTFRLLERRAPHHDLKRHDRKALG